MMVQVEEELWQELGWVYGGMKNISMCLCGVFCVQALCMLGGSSYNRCCIALNPLSFDSR